MDKLIEELLGGETFEVLEKCIKTVFASEDCLDGYSENFLREAADKFEEIIHGLERVKRDFGQLLDYNELKKQGAGTETLNRYREEDDEYLKKAESDYLSNHEKRNYMFGYPANMEESSYLSKYLRYLESRVYLMNNCGDPYQRGNYGMDGKETERNIISMFAKNFGLDEGKYWGYITSGGTESNFWAIREGFSRFPKGKLYFSEDTHYSVEKFVVNNKWNKIYPYAVIPSLPDGSIDSERLLKEIVSDAESGKAEGAILILTYGTTVKGAVDPVAKITDLLEKKGVKYYCHLDAALYGGIASSQKNAPKVGHISGLKIDSLSVSLHKFVGASSVNGILLSLDREKRKVIDYIGQEDSTYLGSRDFPPFSTYQTVKEMLYRKPENYYSANVGFFEKLLINYGVPYERFYENGNIFVVNKPADALCKKYQLATFTTAKGEEKAHIIIFPYHGKEIMEELVRELKN